MSFLRVYDIQIDETPHGYSCRASAEVRGKSRPFSFTLLVPPGSYAKIESGFSRRFGITDVRQLFEVRIRQYVENGTLIRWNIDLGSLDFREVDGLFSDIKRDVRRQKQFPHRHI